MIKAGRKPDRRCGGINNNNTKKEQEKPKRLPCLSNKAKTPNGKQKLGKTKRRPDSRTHSGGECCTFHLNGQIEKAGEKPEENPEEKQRGGQRLFARIFHARTSLGSHKSDLHANK